MSTTDRVFVISGTSTDVGKTIVTAALAAAFAAEGSDVAVCKPAQTGIAPGEPGDLADVTRLVGALTTAECARYPDPLAPETAARLANAPYLVRTEVNSAIGHLATDHDVVLVEGAGGALVRLAPSYTVLDVAADHDAPVLIVVDPGLGTLNHAELTVEAIRARGLTPAGLIIGSWPDTPDLA
ncbi:ATP-dependent dethiobiotin synthetase BioD, partial [Gordonia effusa NBRC 100432]